MRSETIQEPEDSLGFTDNNEWYYGSLRKL